MKISNVNSRLTAGRLALLSDDEAEALTKIAAVPGDYIELGTLWGGSAILAALAKIEKGTSGHVYTVDFMKGGYWDTGDVSLPGLPRPTEKAIYDNLAAAGVKDRVTVIRAPSYPWPVPKSVTPTSVFIDCDHEYEGCLRDWNSVKSLMPLFVAFHDYNPKTHPGVVKVVDDISKKDDKYKPYSKAGTLVVFYLPPSPKKPEVHTQQVSQAEPEAAKKKTSKIVQVTK